MPDKKIVCKDCGKTFLFTESEQDFYKEKNFENEPQRCPDCRRARKQQRFGNRRSQGGPRKMYEAVCDACGKETTVPFQPTGDKPVYCSECYQERK
ncbi:MAG: zinc-ribbon domain containing protein [Bacilli bacterium]|nr:zinc-ribbon domain containing protein [Bacilli bacterium]